MLSLHDLDFNTVNHLVDMEMKVFYIIFHDATVDKYVWALRKHINVRWSWAGVVTALK